MSEQIMNGLELVKTIATIIAAFVSIYAGVFQTRKLIHAKKKGIKKNFISYFILGILFLIGLVLILFAFSIPELLYRSKINESVELKQKRYELLRERDDLYFEIVQEYENLSDIDSHPSRSDSISVSKKALKLRNKIISFQDTHLDPGLKIFKYDNLSYTYDIIAALERTNTSANTWADSAVAAIRKALQWINFIESRPSGFSEEYLQRLLVWINDDDVKNRLYYLWGWALAIKLVNHDINVQPSDIEAKIGNISTDIYLESYPIKLIYQFQQLEGQFSESFRHRYFR
ncbi:MAG: hypothetical protein GWP06_09875 [Actinobacteria bacterium]|nr:hypothetical protein [Actinomycetota bacterium]